MKKILILLFLALLLVLSACGSKATTTESSGMITTSIGEISPEMELIIGTFQLDGTEDEVTSAQAEDLLPLWQAYLALSQADTTAQEELDALVTQIQEAMGAEKMDAIAAMKITQEDVASVMQARGIQFGGRNMANASGTPMPGEDGGTMVFQAGPGDGSGQSFSAGQGGGPPSGVIPPGGGAGFVTSGSGPMGGGGEGIDPSAMATMQASGVQAPMRMLRVPTPLVQALIDYLKAR